MEKAVPNKKELKRIDWDIVKRLLQHLYYDEKEKKTNLAMKCSLCYDKFMLYLNWLDMMDLVYRKVDGRGFELIKLNRKGLDLFNKIR